LQGAANRPDPDTALLSRPPAGPSPAVLMPADVGAVHLLDDSLVDLTGDTPSPSPHKRARLGDQRAAAVSQLLEVVPGADEETARKLLVQFSYASPAHAVALAAAALLDGTAATILRGAGEPARDSPGSEALVQALIRANEGELECDSLALAARMEQEELQSAGADADLLLDSQLAQRLQEEEESRALQQRFGMQHPSEHQPLSACCADPGPPREEASGRAPPRLLELLCARVLEEAAGRGARARPAEAVVCRDVEFFGSVFERSVFERSGQPRPPPAAGGAGGGGAAPSGDVGWGCGGDVGWGCGYRNIQMLVSHLHARARPQEKNEAAAAAGEEEEEEEEEGACAAGPGAAAQERGGAAASPYRDALFAGAVRPPSSILHPCAGPRGKAAPGGGGGDTHSQCPSAKARGSRLLAGASSAVCTFEKRSRARGVSD
jgi:hypothetical protein